MKEKKTYEKAVAIIVNTKIIPGEGSLDGDNNCGGRNFPPHVCPKR